MLMFELLTVISLIEEGVFRGSSFLLIGREVVLLGDKQETSMGELINL